MVTYFQLETEPWWDREVVPAPLVQLGQRLRAAHGRPAVAVGVKGDRFHLAGSHRSQEWILKSQFCTNRTYTVQSGLTGIQQLYLAGFDYNPGSERLMIQLCRRLDEAVRAGRLEVVREWYGNTDGDERVDGFDNVRNRVATSDKSHLWHVHITFDRRQVNDEAAVRRVGDVLLGEVTQQEDDVELDDEVTVQPWITKRWPDESLADGKISVNAALGSGYGHSRAANEQSARGLTAIARIEAVLKVLAGQDPARAVREEFANLLAGLGAIIREEITEASEEQIERIFRRVIGSVDEGVTS